ncbi:hypothetical protein J4209_03050 [Candidatus Woesearchaeota archaeon]|nr:hypothetical protein [Candidatus Woesearchaeota archaeon]
MVEKLRDILSRLDLNGREESVRRVVKENLPHFGHLEPKDQIIAIYFIQTMDITSYEKSAEEIARLQTTGERHTGEKTLLQESTGKFIDHISLDDNIIGLVRIAFPLQNVWDAKHDTIYSTEILHIVAGAVQFDFPKNIDIKLVHLYLPQQVIDAFPGPAFGPGGLRKLAKYGQKIAFGTIGKPKTGLTPEEYAPVIAEAAKNPLFLFVKDDENFGVWYGPCPLDKRVKAVSESIKRANKERGEGEIIYAPHIGNAVQNLIGNAGTALDNGATAIMFSEIYGRGGVRMVRDHLAKTGRSVPIYGHNGGITPLTKAVYREILDMLARLDGIDLRQTGPVGTHKIPLLRPYGDEWVASELALMGELGKHKPVMIARAGGLDQGNIILNLDDITERGYNQSNFLMLAGSAINEWRNPEGKYDPKGGAEAMQQAINAYDIDGFDALPKETHIQRLYEHAKAKGYKELVAALEQRYKEMQLGGR